MSTATKQVSSGIGGWVGHMVDAAAAIPGHYRDLIAKRRGRTILLTILGIPLIHDDAPIGVLSVWRYEVRAFSEPEINLLSTFADQAG